MEKIITNNSTAANPLNANHIYAAGNSPGFDLSLFKPVEVAADIKKMTTEYNEDSRNGVYTATELLNRNISKIPCLLEPILPKVGLCGFAGSSDTGKSTFLRQLAIAVCIGEKEFLGFKLNTPNKRAIYVSTEDDDDAISFLLKEACKTKNLKPEEYCGLTYIFDTENLLSRLKSLLLTQSVDLIVIDAFTDIYGRSMNDSNQVRTFLNSYSQLAQKYRCLIVFLHHTGKRTEELAPSKHNLLGSQGFEAKMRIVIELRTDSNTPDFRHLCIVKGNYLSAEYKNESFVLRFDNDRHFTMTKERRHFERLTTSKRSENKELALRMASEGKTQAEIAGHLEISQATVSRYLKT
ncbi:AAA family ATPase [Sunxiuqinia sp. sy24]|uniref:AAA family ATPase n=1 Tax=Sunxiuqinia sp. sy24 TaxID=3461495 RepID=UPI0040464077